eukprot:8821198-Ditylum_brightwellii.AAC.1
MANAIVDEETGRAMEYRYLIKETNTILFVRHDELPDDRKRDATYGRIGCDYRPQKEEENRMQLTVG